MCGLHGDVERDPASSTPARELHPFGGGRDPGTRDPALPAAPQDALWAIRAGTRVGCNIARAVRGRKPRAFGYRGLGLAAGFGRGRAMVRIWGVPLTGPAAWVIRMGFFLWIMPSRRQALRLVRAYGRPVAPSVPALGLPTGPVTTAPVILPRPRASEPEAPTG